MTDDDLVELHMAAHGGPKGPQRDAAVVLLAEVKRQRETLGRWRPWIIQKQLEEAGPEANESVLTHIKAGGNLP